MKNKIRVLVLMASLIGAPTYASTDPKTIQFLEQLNRYYYCLMREGLNGFHCDVQISWGDNLKKQYQDHQVSEAWIAAVQDLKYILSVSPNGSANITPVPPAATGNAGFDASIEKTQNDYGNFMANAVEVWTESVYKPLSDQHTYNGDCRVINGTDGFKVVETWDGGMLTLSFDRKAMELGTVGRLGQAEINLIPSYTDTPKGFLLTGLRGNVGTMKVNCGFDYAALGGFQLLKRLSMEMPEVPGLKGKLLLLLTFSNYQLGQ